mmetsp:Transcript_114471/g.318719  ORF Transcript_114471/g.318719 Transcript_114471/m.318719 type:complete len:213 (-) Transcript_114471:71-709(-)
MGSPRRWCGRTSSVVSTPRHRSSSCTCSGLCCRCCPSTTRGCSAGRTRSRADGSRWSTCEPCSTFLKPKGRPTAPTLRRQQRKSSDTLTKRVLATIRSGQGAMISTALVTTLLATGSHTTLTTLCKVGRHTTSGRSCLAAALSSARPRIMWTSGESRTRTSCGSRITVGSTATTASPTERTTSTTRLPRSEKEASKSGRGLRLLTSSAGPFS